MKILIIANWKCNPTKLKEARRLFDSVIEKVKNVKKTEVVICPPFLYIPELGKVNYKIRIGAQDCFWGEEGAFTGEVSPKMLKNIGCQHVILGHSERRKYQKEIDELINRKIKAALLEKLKPVLCIEKESQIKKGLKGISAKELKKVTLAYEPVFAIGTGKPCSIEKAKRVRGAIKKNFKNNPVLYGGSVNSKNAKDYIEKADFQGLLVGGASLNSSEFVKIVKSIDSILKI